MPSSEFRTPLNLTFSRMFLEADVWGRAVGINVSSNARKVNRSAQVNPAVRFQVRDDSGGTTEVASQSSILEIEIFDPINQPRSQKAMLFGYPDTTFVE